MHKLLVQMCGLHTTRSRAFLKRGIPACSYALSGIQVGKSIVGSIDVCHDLSRRNAL